MAEDLGAAARTSGGILSWAGAEGSGVWFAFGEEHSALCRVRMNCWGPCGQGRPTEKVPATGPGGGPGEDWGATGVLAGAGGVCISRRTVGGEEVGVAEDQGFWSEHCRIEDAPSRGGERARGAEVKAAAGPGHTELETLRWAELCPLPKVSGEALTCKVQNASALGGKVFKEVISSNEALGGGP